MDFLRRHLFYIVCGVAAAAGIALGVTGLSSMSQVITELGKPETLYRSLQNLQSNPVNRDRIMAEDQRIASVKQDNGKVKASAKKLVGYEPLIPDLFPGGKQDELTKSIQFRTAYGRAMDRLFASLHSGGPATARDVAIMQDKIAGEKETESEYGLDRGASLPDPPLPGPSETPAGVLTKFGALDNAVARAHMAAAQRINCYAVHYLNERLPSRPSSLSFEESMADTGSVDAPLLEDLWWAQIGLWIQKDVVEAIVALNDEAAAEAAKNGRDSWVATMPIKELISVRVASEYVTVDSEGEDPEVPGDHTAAQPLGSASSAFTGSTSGPLYEVVQWSLKLVADQRDLLRLADKLCKNSFHTLLAVSYQVVPTNRKMVGKIYGSEPTVNVVMEFETIMLGDVFRPLMPQDVCDYFEISCPEPQEDEEEG